MARGTDSGGAGTDICDTYIRSEALPRMLACGASPRECDYMRMTIGDIFLSGECSAGLLPGAIGNSSYMYQ
jgi:hypothetical protein